MEDVKFSFKTQYDFKTFIRISRAARKTVRKQSSLILNLCSIMAGVALVIKYFPKEDMEISLSTVMIWITFGLLIIALLFQDVIEASFFKRATKPEDMTVSTEFGEEGYIIRSQGGDVNCKYSDIEALVEIDEGFVLCLGNNVYKMLSKENLTGGTADDFKTFIENKTGKSVQSVR
jgi:hypothetical protein